MTLFELGNHARSTYVETEDSMTMLPLDEDGSGGGAAAGELVQTTLDDFSKKKRQPPSRKGIKHTPEALRKISEASRRNWARPNYRKGLKEKRSGKNHHFYGKTFSEEYRAKLSEAHMGQTAWNKGINTGPLTEEHREAIAEGNRGKTMSEEAKAKISAAWTPERRNELSTSMTGETNPAKRLEARTKNSAAKTGENHPMWKGGRSFEPYCPKFNDKLKERVRNVYDRTCLSCGSSEMFNKERLSVHHLDNDKLQGCLGKRWALVPLCHSCHSQLHGAKGHEAIELEFLLATKAEEYRRSGL